MRSAKALLASIKLRGSYLLSLVAGHDHHFRPRNPLCRSQMLERSSNRKLSAGSPVDGPAEGVRMAAQSPSADQEAWTATLPSGQPLGAAHDVFKATLPAILT
jgi:hypothetical protein